MISAINIIKKNRQFLPKIGEQNEWINRIFTLDKAHIK
jgi:hypothetical protein